MFSIAGRLKPDAKEGGCRCGHGAQGGRQEDHQEERKEAPADGGQAGLREPKAAPTAHRCLGSRPARRLKHLSACARLETLNGLKKTQRIWEISLKHAKTELENRLLGLALLQTENVG